MSGEQIEADDQYQQSCQCNVVDGNFRCFSAGKIRFLLCGFRFDGADQFFVGLDRFLNIHPQANRVSSNKSTVENAAGKKIESFVFDGFEKARIDPRISSNFVDGKVL